MKNNDRYLERGKSIFLDVQSKRFKAMPVDEISAQLLIPHSFVSIDFETLYAQRVSVCSIGMVKYKNGEIVDRYYSLIKPLLDYPSKCGVALTWVHGFTEDMLVAERTFAEILPEVEFFVEGLPLVAHNACVEKACIRDAAQYYGLDTVLDYECIIDTYSLSKRIEKSRGFNISGRGMYTLDAVCRRFNVQEMEHHNALDDAEMCGNLLIALTHVVEKEMSAVQPSLTSRVADSAYVQVKINPEDKIQRIDLENVNDNLFKNKVVVLTGFAKSCSREYAHRLNELGAIVRDSVCRNTEFLITGYNAGPAKLKKAEDFGVCIMPEIEFLEIIKSI